jgi:hypothetical protein
MAKPELTAAIIYEDDHSLTFEVRDGDRLIGEIDVELPSDSLGFISGISEQEEINNGYLGPASLAVAEFLRQETSGHQVKTFFGLDNKPL